jgi:hypothetical protein
LFWFRGEKKKRVCFCSIDGRFGSSNA